MSVNVCRKNSYSVTVAVIVTCPIISWLAVVHEVTVTWVNSVNVRFVVRTDLLRAIRSYVHSAWFLISWAMTRACH